jgi:hypothetical protein
MGTEQTPSPPARSGWKRAFHGKVGAAILAAVTLLAGAGIGSSSSSKTGSSSASAVVTVTQASTVTEPATNNPPSTTATPKLTTKPKPKVPARPAAKLNGSCNYLLGNFTETNAGFRFVSVATIHNTGNIGVVVRFDATWRQTSSPAIHASKKVRVPRGRTVFVSLSRVVGQDQIDQIQAIPQGSECGWKGTLVKTFGRAK